MLIESEQLGAVEIDDTKVLSFPDGLLGFPDVTRFALVDAGDDATYFWLQSLDDPQLAFLATVPWPFFPEYEPVLSDSDQDALDLQDPGDAMVLCLLTISDDAVTANLLGPLVVNAVSRTGRQVVLDGDLPTRAPLAAI
ncbi:flagellar assembly protein FliW [Actinomarinicola tropica]|uniref:Flagellar assembly factor FliW n=1 Tax=Actinomarinicola tropica TaxID=2789776 RepID=A0A5Q2RIF3_9ACTN|nr:flagellar assembly protein FliW [Actinomarinicola tropica]QGG94662.1 flagellar assembly protein FliW [Actinomarinicola tropica]